MRRKGENMSRSAQTCRGATGSPHSYHPVNRTPEGMWLMFTAPWNPWPCAARGHSVAGPTRCEAQGPGQVLRETAWLRTGPGVRRGTGTQPG